MKKTHQIHAFSSYSFAKRWCKTTQVGETEVNLAFVHAGKKNTFVKFYKTCYKNVKQVQALKAIQSWSTKASRTY